MIRTYAATPLLALLFALTTACNEGVPAIGPNPVRATANATTLLDALADRFGPVQLSPELARTRPRLTRYSLTPSRILDDTAMWTSRGDDDRTLEIAGAPRGGIYTLFPYHGVQPPRTPGHARHVMHLEVLGDDEFRWTSIDEVALGPITTADLDRALTAIFLAAERSDGDATRTQARAAFPRASASLARMFVIDSLRNVRDPDGATSVVLGIGLRPAHSERFFQSLGAYARKYWVPIRWRMVLRDSLDVRWGEFTKRDSSIVLRFRVKDGSLAPLNAAPRRLDDVMRLTADASVKVGIFRVGVRDLDVLASRSAGATTMSLTFRFLDEPEWQLPPLVARLIRSPLRRPFEGSGALMRYGVRTEVTGDDTASTVWRDIDVTVRESGILRFVGRLGGTALSDFRAGAEREAERLWGETLSGLAKDVECAGALRAGRSTDCD